VFIKLSFSLLQQLNTSHMKVDDDCTWSSNEMSLSHISETPSSDDCRSRRFAPPSLGLFDDDDDDDDGNGDERRLRRETHGKQSNCEHVGFG